MLQSFFSHHAQCSLCPEANSIAGSRQVPSLLFAKDILNFILFTALEPCTVLGFLMAFEDGLRTNVVLLQTCFDFTQEK